MEKLTENLEALETFAKAVEQVKVSLRVLGEIATEAAALVHVQAQTDIFGAMQASLKAEKGLKKARSDVFQEFKTAILKCSNHQPRVFESGAQFFHRLANMKESRLMNGFMGASK